MPTDPVADPLYQAGYRQGLADAVVAPVEQVSERRRYMFATGTLLAGVGSASLGVMLFSPKHRALGGVIAFSVGVLSAAFAAAHILVDDQPVTPTLHLKV